MNPRETLGVSSDASQTEIKQAFRKAAKELHPDHSDSPEAAEAFRRIKEAHDALIKSADTPRESISATQAAAKASAATARAAYSQTPPPAITDEELKRIQELDEIVRQSQKKSFFKRNQESTEIKKHRKKIKTNNRRLRGLY
jgi:curved DNA-binding protein CbpA